MPESDDREWQFHRLWSEAQTAVGGLVRSLVHDKHLADDILQETAMSCFRNLDRYQADRPFVAWALAIAKNKVRDAWRKQQRQRVVVLDDAVLTQLTKVAADIEPVLSQRREVMEQCLRKVEGRPRKIPGCFL